MGVLWLITELKNTEMTNRVHIFAITKYDVTSLVIVWFSQSKAFRKAVDL